MAESGCFEKIKNGFYDLLVPKSIFSGLRLDSPLPSFSSPPIFSVSIDGASLDELHKRLNFLSSTGVNSTDTSLTVSLDHFDLSQKSPIYISGAGESHHAACTNWLCRNYDLVTQTACALCSEYILNPSNVSIKKTT
jgi:hypothetical protein